MTHVCACLCIGCDGGCDGGCDDDECGWMELKTLRPYQHPYHPVLMVMKRLGGTFCVVVIVAVKMMVVVIVVYPYPYLT